VLRIGVAERRARLAVRHHLSGSSRAASPVEVAGDLVGLHGTDPATVHLAAAARLAKPEVAAVERALYEERTLVRVLGMRRTMFIEQRSPPSRRGSSWSAAGSPGSGRARSPIWHGRGGRGAG
jgi:hypothetical protein